MIIDFNESCYYYDRIISDAKRLADNYEEVLTYVTIGVSHDNRDIAMLKLGTGQKYITCCAGVHGRETINPVVMLRIIEYYADLYVNHKQQKKELKNLLTNPNFHLEAEYEQMIYGTCIYELLQTFTILFIPLLNPDGYMIALKGFDVINDQKLKRKCLALNMPYEEWKGNARGVDLNRNFPSQLWKAKNEKDYAASENETKALLFLFHEYRSLGFLDFHSRGKMIYYYRSMMPDSYNNKQLEIASRFKDITNYELVLPVDEMDAGDSGGNTVHYYSERFGKPALTIETVEEIATFPLEKQYRMATFEELKLVIFEFGSMII